MHKEHLETAAIDAVGAADAVAAAAVIGAVDAVDAVAAAAVIGAVDAIAAIRRGEAFAPIDRAGLDRQPALENNTAPINAGKCFAPTALSCHGGGRRTTALPCHGWRSPRRHASVERCRVLVKRCRAFVEQTRAPSSAARSGHATSIPKRVQPSGVSSPGRVR
jgi:hypothetical protein